MSGQRFSQYRAAAFVCLLFAESVAWGQLNYDAPASPHSYSEFDWGWQEDFRLEMPWDEDAVWTNLGVSPYGDIPIAEPGISEKTAAKPVVSARPPEIDRFTLRVQEALANVGSLKTQARTDALQGFLPPSTQGQYSLSLKSLDTLSSSWFSPNDPLGPPKPNAFSLDVQEILRAAWSERTVTVSEDPAPPASEAEVFLPDDSPPKESDLSSHQVQRQNEESKDDDEGASTLPATTTVVDDEKPGELDRQKEKSSENGKREETLLGDREDAEDARGLAQKTALERLDRTASNRSALSSQQLRSRAAGPTLTPGQDDGAGAIGSTGKISTKQTQTGPRYYRTTTGDVRQPDYTYRFQGPRRYSVGEREYGNQQSYQGLPYYRRRN